MRFPLSRVFQLLSSHAWLFLLVVTMVASSPPVASLKEPAPMPEQAPQLQIISEEDSEDTIEEVPETDTQQPEKVLLGDVPPIRADDPGSDVQEPQATPSPPHNEGKDEAPSVITHKPK